MDLDNIMPSKSTMLGTTIDTQRVITKKRSPNLKIEQVIRCSPRKKKSSNKKRLKPPNDSDPSSTINMSGILTPITKSGKRTQAKAAFELYKQSVT